ncbi:MAG: hypothetical protein FWC09_05065 [Lachnospiraceae bacterium]|nr:hypothetical protein [Lachnospiraceae bacterium]
MSLPKFPDSDTILTRDEAVNAILTSIAMEESALSHIINAEGEKIQYVLAKKCTDLCEVIAVNNSVASVIDKIIDLQFLLKVKMQHAKDFTKPTYCVCCPMGPDNNCHPDRPEVCPPRPRPRPPMKPEPPKKCHCGREFYPGNNM